MRICHKRVLLLVLISIIVSMSIIEVYAAIDIVLDGYFSDWSDKPQLSDAKTDGSPGYDIDLVRWYPNNVDQNLYLFCERSTSNNKDWNFTVNLTGDLGMYNADVSYKRVNQNVNVTLYDSNRTRVWSGSGRWGETRTPGRRVEFKIPLTYIVSNIVSGYQIDMYFRSGKDRVPDSDVIRISSVSTYPVYTIIGLLLFLAIAACFYKYKNDKSYYFNMKN